MRPSYYIILLKCSNKLLPLLHCYIKSCIVFISEVFLTGSETQSQVDDINTTQPRPPGSCKCATLLNRCAPSSANGLVGRDEQLKQVIFFHPFENVPIVSSPLFITAYDGI